MRSFASLFLSLTLLAFAIMPARAFAADGRGYYQGESACSVCALTCFFTAVETLMPIGNGRYSSGTQVVYGADANSPSSGCTFSLNSNASSYSLSSTGIGTETLSWTAAPSNDPSCPQSYVDRTSIVISLHSSNTKVADNNLANQGGPGIGSCSNQQIW